jgi:hypothetical protein
MWTTLSFKEADAKGGKRSSLDGGVPPCASRRYVVVVLPRRFGNGGGVEIPSGEAAPTSLDWRGPFAVLEGVLKGLPFTCIHRRRVGKKRSMLPDWSIINSAMVPKRCLTYLLLLLCFALLRRSLGSTYLPRVLHCTALHT